MNDAGDQIHWIDMYCGSCGSTLEVYGVVRGLLAGD